MRTSCLPSAAILLSLAVSVSAVSTSAFAVPDSNAYWQAARAQALVDTIKSPVPAAEFKEALLKRTRPEDREFAKSLLIQWKRNSAEDVRAEFNRLIIRDVRGKEALVIVPVENAPGKFRVNGAEWEIPESGSIFKSLRTFTQKKAPSSSASIIFDFVSPRAHAALETADPATFGFMYAFATVDGSVPHTAKTHLAAYSPAKILMPTEGGLTSKIVDRIRGKSQITCGADSATGRMLISNQPVDFSVRRDGSVILTPFDSKQSIRASSAVTPLFGAAAVYERDLSFETCLDAACSRVAGLPKNSLRSFLRPIQDDYVDQAVTFRPRDFDKPTYPIEFSCEDASDCNQMEINGLEKLSKYDAGWATKYRNEANESLRKRRSEQNAMVLSVRPLFACCQDTSCRTAVLEQGVQLKGNSGGTATATSGSTAP